MMCRLEFGYHDVTPYFGIANGNLGSPNGLRTEAPVADDTDLEDGEIPPESPSHPHDKVIQSEEEEPAKMHPSEYNPLLGREGSYRWYRLENKPPGADDMELEEGEIPPESSHPDEQKRAAFIAQSREWMQKYIENVKETSHSTRRPEDDDAQETSPLQEKWSHTKRLRSTSLNPAGRAARKVERLKEGRQKPPSEITEIAATDGSRRALIQKTLQIFQELWSYHEFSTEVTTGQSKRGPRHSAMKVAAHMRENKLSLDDDIIGEIEGVDVGDSFNLRAEMCVIGLHKELMAGINVLKRPDSEGGPIATSVVFGIGSSYSDNMYRENDTSVYSGEGGLPSSSSKGSAAEDVRVYRDQKLTPGNVALIRSLEQKIPIRVIKGVEKVKGRKYVYDGLHEITDYKYEKGVHGNKVYKFMLRRLRC